MLSEGRGRPVYRPRLFTLAVVGLVYLVVGHAGRASRNCSGSSDERREAMGCPWLAGDSLPEAIPPSYGEFVGGQLFSFLLREAVAENAA